MSDDNHPNPSDTKTRPSALPWPPILLVAAVACAVVMGRVMPLDWPGEDDMPARIVGYAFGALGLGLIAWAAMVFRSAKTTILPHAGATSLVTTGPFRRFRNPIYLGDTLILLSLGEITHNVWFVVAAALFVVLVTWLAILPEERHLEATFGEEYLAYKAQSRRWI